MAVAYFAHFGSSFRIPVFGGFVSSVLDSARRRLISPDIIAGF